MCILEIKLAIQFIVFFVKCATGNKDADRHVLKFSEVKLWNPGIGFIISSIEPHRIIGTIESHRNPMCIYVPIVPMWLIKTVCSAKYQNLVAC